MVRGFAIIFSLLGAIGCSHVSQQNQQQVWQQQEALLWQQAEQIQKQRASILELQQQREQMQKQLVQLTLSHNNNMPMTVPAVEGAASESPKPEQIKKRVQVDETGKIVLGQVEWAWFDLFGNSVKARIDTGAKSSTLHASDVQIFERDGEGWVRFSISSDWNGDGQAAVRSFEAPLVRRVKVKPSKDEPASRRPVVRLTTKVGSIIDDIEFVVQSKDSGAFPVVLGRSFIRDIAIVDVAQQYTQAKHTRASKL